MCVHYVYLLKYPESRACVSSKSKSALLLVFRMPSSKVMMIFLRDSARDHCSRSFVGCGIYDLLIRFARIERAVE